jgi:hypothetical protein
MGFAQHQSFYLRDGWLRRALNKINPESEFEIADPYFFHDPEAYEKIGLGKNMVQALRHWVQACGVAYEPKEGKQRRKPMWVTKLGQLVSTYDPYLELPYTISILHYHITRDIERATSWYWFFQLYLERSFTKEQLINDLSHWVAQNSTKSVSATSIKKDVDCLLNMYVRNEKIKDPEEVIESPMSGLRLLQQEDDIYIRESGRWTNIGLPALYYVLLDFCRNQKLYDIPLDEIIYCPGLWGRTYQMERVEIIEALDKLTLHKIYPISFTRTNELNIVRVPEITPEDILLHEYQQSVRFFENE